MRCSNGQMDYFEFWVHCWLWVFPDLWAIYNHLRILCSRSTSLPVTARLTARLTLLLCAWVGAWSQCRFCPLMTSEQSELGKRSPPTSPALLLHPGRPTVPVFKCTCPRKHLGTGEGDTHTCTRSTCVSWFSKFKSNAEKNQWIKVLKIRFVTHLCHKPYLVHPHRRALILGSQFLTLCLNC